MDEELSGLTAADVCARLAEEPVTRSIPIVVAAFPPGAQPRDAWRDVRATAICQLSSEAGALGKSIERALGSSNSDSGIRPSAESWLLAR